MSDRKENSSKEYHPLEEQKVRKKESMASMLERGVKALEGNKRLFEQRRKERGEVDTSAKDVSGGSGSSGYKKK